MDTLDQKLLSNFSGRVVRKDLLHKIKKGINVPTFVLEFLLARYCASDDPSEIEVGMEAVIATLQENYVRPDESNRAQSVVQQKGKHKYIDKVHVRYLEKEKRHWATLENFNSKRVAIQEKYYRENVRLLEGGLWAEVDVGHNDIEEDNYAFYLEDLRPIQLGRFNVDAYMEGRKQFTRDEWIDVLMRSTGLNPDKFNLRTKFHILARLICLVEPNYNFIELGPRATGKSYFFSEFSPYSTLISGGQATTPTLFYNLVRRDVGLIGFWDTVAFDEVGGMKIKDPNTIDIMKDYMANGRFNRGVEVIANASFAFIGNIDESIEMLVEAPELDLFQPLPANFDLAIMDRLCMFLPGWEIPKNDDSHLTKKYGFITDYLAEAMHYLSRRTNRYEYAHKKSKLGKSVEGRDEKGIMKTVCGLLKLLHPTGEPTDAEFEQYLNYAIEGRRRVKEQMNKRKPDDEFANVNLSYFSSNGNEIIVYCPESKHVSPPPLIIKEGEPLSQSETSIDCDAVLKMIQQGEGRTIEFKSTLQYNKHTKMADPKLAYMVCRAIASFANTDGGVLLVGVHDEGDVLGLDYDYSIAGHKQDADNLKLKFDDLIDDKLGKAAHGLIKAEIVNVEGKDILCVVVDKAKKEVFVEESDFFVRGAASSRKLTGKEMMEYLKEHW